MGARRGKDDPPLSTTLETLGDEVHDHNLKLELIGKQVREHNVVLKNHAARLEEIGEDMAAVKTDIGWLKYTVKKMDYRVWAILAGIVMILITLLG